MKIIHLSKTPLAGSPSRISDALNQYTDCESYHFIEADYPGELKGRMTDRSLTISLENGEYWLFKKLMKEADIVHIHNEISESTIELLGLCSENCKFIYHVHSPLREGPLFTELCGSIGIDFDQKLVVAQYHPRLYQDYTPVLNLVPFIPSLNILGENEIPKLLFSPAHRRIGGRWNDKVSEGLLLALESLNKFKKIELIDVSAKTPYELFVLRKHCHITIDEIVTGSYHQISLEGLAAGNLVINNSDYFSDLFLSITSDGYEIPFVKSDSDGIYDLLTSYLDYPDKIRSKQTESYNFFNSFLLPKNVIQKYKQIYSEILGG